MFVDRANLKLKAGDGGNGEQASPASSARLPSDGDDVSSSTASGCGAQRSSLTVAGAAPESGRVLVDGGPHRLPVEPSAVNTTSGTWCKRGGVY